MKNDDLSKVKHVGAVRMKRLKDSGITTFAQLCEIPLEKLAQIDTIGQHYAKLIQESAMGLCEPAQDKAPAAVSVDKPPKKSKVDQNFNRQVKLLRRRIKQTNEKLKPLGKKKYLAAYVECRKSSKRLMANLKGVVGAEDALSKKVKKRLAQKAESLNLDLKKVGKKPKKKIYNQVCQDIRVFSEMLEKTSS